MHPIPVSKAHGTNSRVNKYRIGFLWPVCQYVFKMNHIHEFATKDIHCDKGDGVDPSSPLMASGFLYAADWEPLYYNISGK